MLSTDRCILVLACITGIFICSPLIQGCEDPYLAHDDSCYHLVSFSKSNWKRAEESCINQGGHLASVTSQDEYDFISKTVQEGASGKEVWIGLYHNATAGGWKWTDGSPYSFSSWASQEPGTNDQYVRIQNGAWFGVEQADIPHYHMCKKPDQSREQELTPTSSTTSSQHLPEPRDSRAETETTMLTMQSTTTKTTYTPSTTSQTTTTKSSTRSTTSTATPSTRTTTVTTTPSTTTVTSAETSSTTSTTLSTKSSTMSDASTTLTPINSEVTENEFISTISNNSSSNTPRIDSVSQHTSNQTRNIGIIIGCVLGFLFVVILVAIFCIISRNSKQCCQKIDDDYVEPLKSSKNGQTDKQVVGDILAQGNSNIYFELQDKPPQNGHMILNDVRSVTKATPGGEILYDNHHNTMAEDNIYDSIRHLDDRSRAPNPYYNT